MADDAPEKESPPTSDVRRTRRLQAAYAMSRSIRHSNSFGWEWTLDEADARARVIEIEALLGLLKEGDLPGERANSKPEEPSESVRTLLLSSVHPGTEYHQFSSALDTFERVLAAQLISHGASPTNVAQGVSTPQAAPAGQADAQNPSEIPLLDVHSERFFQSPAFKVICAGLSAAALLAGGGALYFGSKVVQYAQQAAEAAGRSEQQATALGVESFRQLSALNNPTPQESVRLSEIRKQIEAQEAALSDEIMPRIKQLRKDLSVASPPPCEQPGFSDSPEAIRTKLDCLKTRIADIEGQAPKNSIGALSEDDLSPQHWRQIQEALANKGFYKGKVDGKAGRTKLHFGHMTGTRRAIFRWQGALSEIQTGALTPVQIQSLLGAGPVTR